MPFSCATVTESSKIARSSNLPISEFGERYRQQFIDRLWMRGLFAIAGLYLIGVAIYMVALGYSTIQTQGVENRVADMGPTYTNAIQLRDRYRVLKDRQELKFADLGVWRTVSPAVHRPPVDAWLVRNRRSLLDRRRDLHGRAGIFHDPDSRRRKPRC